MESPLRLGKPSGASNRMAFLPRQRKVLAMPEMTRRLLLQYSGALAASALFGASRRASAAPRAKVESTTVISKQPHLYHGWPTLTRRRNGQLLLVYSGGREAHVCPFGRVEIMRSRDNGDAWTWPQVLLDSPIDDRDA